MSTIRGWSPDIRLSMDIFLSIKPSVEDIAGLFDVALPVVVLDDWNDARARELGSVHTVILTENRSEFPFGLSFQDQDENQELWLLKSARTLSQKLRCRTLYTGSPVNPKDPFLCVVFESGRAYLASDEGSCLAEGEGGPVRILQRLPELDD